MKSQQGELSQTDPPKREKVGVERKGRIGWERIKKRGKGERDGSEEEKKERGGEGLKGEGKRKERGVKRRKRREGQRELESERVKH